MSALVPAKWLELTPPDDPKKPWVAAIGDATPMRLTPDIAKILKWYQDGKPGSVETYLGKKLTTAELKSATDMLQSHRLLTEENSSGPSFPTSSSRLRFNSLFSIQFAILNKQRHFAWLKNISNKTALMVAVILNLIMSILGIIVIIADNRVFYEALTTPQPLAAVWILLIFLVISISMHEFAHAAVLTYFGGQVRRIGVMLFYLSPAFFCDVTDAWRLQNKNQRTLTAFAGVIATFGIAGCATIAYTFFPSAQWLGIAAIALYFGSVLNLIPFIKLDGYIALMTYVDEPNLRSSTMDDWKRALVMLLDRQWVGIRQFRLWRLFYGLAASATPVILILVLARSFNRSGAGSLSAVTASALALIVVALIARGLYRIATIDLNGMQVRRLSRLWAALISVGILSLCAMVPLPKSVYGSYWVSNGQLVTDLTQIGSTGEIVKLRQDGLVASINIGTGRVSDQQIVSDVPVQALSPNIIVEQSLPPKLVVKIDDYHGKWPNWPGTLMIERERQPLGEWVVNTLLLDKLG